MLATERAKIRRMPRTVVNEVVALRRRNMIRTVASASRLLTVEPAMAQTMSKLPDFALDGMTVPALLALAKSKGLTATTKTRKAELIALLSA